MGDFETLALSHPSPGVAVLSLNRPERRNAMTTRMFGELHEAATALRADPSTRVVLLTGAGRSFCVGFDLEDIDELLRLSPRQRTAYQERSTAAVLALHELPHPVVAAVRGAAAGGGMSLALAADFRLVSETATFTAVFVRIGLSAGGIGMTWMLPRSVGAGIASELMLTGRTVDAEEALAIGLANRVIADDALMDAALESCALIAANSPAAVRMTKRAIQANLDAPPLRAAIELENRGQVQLMGAGDLEEALRARSEGRAPQFPDA